jgi:hypothetical protein
MKKLKQQTVYGILCGENGQALPWMVLLMVLFLGMAGLTLDVGRAYACYRELQASTDAAALAAADELSDSSATYASVVAAGTAYSSATGGINANSNLPGASVNVTPKCLSTIETAGVYCASSAAGNYNSVVVTQTVSIPTYFIQALKVFGLNSATALNMSSVATAAMRSGPSDQYNIAILIDTTPSMADRDYTCSGYSTKIACALAGVRTLLQDIAPCTTDTANASSTCVPFDSVSLFTFPAVKASTAKYDTTCNSRSTPTYMSYTTPVPGAVWTATDYTSSSATYQITDFLSDFSSTNAAGGSLDTSSSLSIASGAGSCSGLQTGGSVRTYFAGAIYAAQSSLVAEQKASSGTKNAMIILTDGDANNATITTSGTVQTAGSTSTSKNSDGTSTTYNYTVKYPNSGSSGNNCQQAIDAANNAKAQGTTVYTVAYAASDSTSSGTCSTDTSGPLGSTKASLRLTACATVKAMATDMDHFYSDDAGSGGSCSATTTKSLTSLSEIFGNIAGSMQKARLIPNGTT